DPLELVGQVGLDVTPALVGTDRSKGSSGRGRRVEVTPVDRGLLIRLGAVEVEPLLGKAVEGEEITGLPSQDVPLLLEGLALEPESSETGLVVLVQVVPLLVLASDSAIELGGEGIARLLVLSKLGGSTSDGLIEGLAEAI